MTDHPLRQRIAAVLDLAPDVRDRVRRQWFTYGQVGALARQIAASVDGRGQVGMLLRNTPPMSPRSSGCCWPAGRSS